MTGTGMPTTSDGQNTHLIRPGDTLWGISRANGATVADLARINGIDTPELIVAGRTLVLPGPGDGAHPAPRPSHDLTRSVTEPHGGGRGYAAPVPAGETKADVERELSLARETIAGLNDPEAAGPPRPADATSPRKIMTWEEMIAPDGGDEIHPSANGEPTHVIVFTEPMVIPGPGRHRSGPTILIRGEDGRLTVHRDPGFVPLDPSSAVRAPYTGNHPEPAETIPLETTPAERPVVARRPLTAPADAPTSGVDEPDAGLIERYDLPASGRHRLDGFDGIIDRKDPAFLAMIDEVAAEYGIPPSVLLANWLRETGGRDHAGEVTNRQNGMPSWHGRRGDDDLGAGIADRRLPGVYDDGVALDRPLYAFATERDAMRAHAAWLADSQERFVDHVGEEEWNALPLSVQGALLRLTFNPGRNNPLTWADRAVAARQDGQDPASAFPQTGGFDSRHPLRTAQSAGAQAAHFHNEGLFPAN